MGITRVNSLKVPEGRAYLGANPTSPDTYYGTGVGHTESRDWRGGEIVYNTNDSRFYINTATSGTTPTWKRLSEQTVSV